MLIHKGMCIHILIHTIWAAQKLTCVEVASNPCNINPETYTLTLGP
jgi:hypothetical protein